MRSKVKKIRVYVEDYYQQELFRFIPEDMFDLLDEAYFWKNSTVKIPEILIEEFKYNKEKGRS